MTVSTDNLKPADKLKQLIQDSLEIFGKQKSHEANVKIWCSLAASGFLLFFPSSLLRWDGSLRDPLDKTPLPPAQQITLERNAWLNRFILLTSAIGGTVTAGYGAVLAFNRDIKEDAIAPVLEETRNIFLEEKLDKFLQEAITPTFPQLKSAEPEGDEIAKLRAIMNADMANFAQQAKAAQATVTATTTTETNTPVNVQPVVQIPTPVNPVLKALQYAKDPANAIDPLALFRKLGETVIESLVSTDKSILFPCGTGTGKTTTLQEICRRMKARYGGLTLYAITQKNDVIFGVEKCNTQMFDPNLLMAFVNQGEPNEDEGGERITLRDVLRPLFEVYDIFDYRRRQPAEKRREFKEMSPVRLILDDWYSTFTQLETILPKMLFNEVMSYLKQIFTVGRDCGVGVFAVTQAVNLKAIGLADAGAAIRECLALVSQGYIRNDEFGNEFGETRTMALMIGNNSIVSPEHRKAVLEAHNYLCELISQKVIQQPMIFLSSGSFPTLGLVPILETVQTAGQVAITVEKEIDLIEELGGTEPLELPPFDEMSETLYKKFLEKNPTIDQNILYGVHQLKAKEMIDQIIYLKKLGANQTESIQKLWEAKPGGTKGWLLAVQQYKLLMSAS